MMLTRLALVLAMPWTAAAWPLGAGRCPAGEAAVAGSHTEGEKEITAGTLADGGFTVSLNGVPLDSAPELRAGQEETITIVSDNGTPFKGFLIRIAAPEGTVVDVRDAIYPISSNDTDTQVSEAACVETELVGGLTHTGASDKTQVSGTIFVDAGMPGIVLDITLVGVNNNDASSYWYSQYEIMAVASDASATPVPSGLSTATTTTDSGSALEIDVDEEVVEMEEEEEEEEMEEEEEEEEEVEEQMSAPADETSAPLSSANRIVTSLMASWLVGTIMAFL
jgi:hypothetical protein